jgi:NADH-quinone oxidoreductase subunit G
MMKRGNEWEPISWEKAFEEIVNRFQAIQSEFSVDKIGALLSPSATVEEAYLLQKLMRSIGSPHIDHRLKMRDPRLDQLFGNAPGLEGSIADFETSDATLLVGCHIRAEVMMNSFDTDPAMPLAVHAIVEDSALVSTFAQVLKVVLAEQPLPPARQNSIHSTLSQLRVTPHAQAIAEHLLKAEKPFVVLGALALHHPDAGRLQSIALLLREALHAKGGVLTEGANAQGAWLVGAVPHRDASGQTPEVIGASAQNMLNGSAGIKAFVLLNTEPEFDSTMGIEALTVLKTTPFVVALSSFNTPGLREYAHVLLPISTFAENEGTYVNVAGSWQSFHMMRQPEEGVKPAWKVLRVMSNFLGVEGFDFNDIEAVRAELKALDADRKHSIPDPILEEIVESGPNGYSRAAPTPIYAIDPIVRQSKSLQATALANQMNCIRVSKALAQELKLNPGDRLTCSQGHFSCLLDVRIDLKQPAHTICIPSGLASTVGLPYQVMPLTVAVQTLQSSPVKESRL